MLIKTSIPDVSHITHNDAVYKVVDGIAEVPTEVRDEFVKFPHWSDVMEPVDEATLKALQDQEEKQPKKPKTKTE